MKKVLSLLVLTAAFAAFPALAKPVKDSTVQTKAVVAAFNKMAFEDRRPVEAAKKYISEKQYIQHNPQGKDGRDSFINGFAKYVIGSEFRCETKRIIAEGDVAVAHAHCKEKPSDRGDAVVDILSIY